MSSARRFAASSIVLLVLGFALCFAQPSSEPSIQIPNWSTPPFWTLRKESPEKSAVQPLEIIRFEPVEAREILSKLAALPISKWSYRLEGDIVRHLGPMAQDFPAAFDLGNDERSISTIDADGVALAAIQALHAMVRERDAEIETLKTRLAKLEAQLR